MKENVLDILMYLFENYLEGELEFISNQEALKKELVEAGFHYGEIDKAFAWLEGMARLRDNGAAVLLPVGNSIRVFTDEEVARLDTECRGFLLFLEQIGVLDLTNRELVIDRVMALESSDDIDLAQLKWVILMVLFNQPGQEAAFAWMEDLVFDEITHSLH